MISIARVRKSTGTLLLGAVLALPGLQLAGIGGTVHAAPVLSTARAAAHVPMAGTWYNINAATREITHLTVTSTVRGQYVHAYGACEPTDCDWGVARLVPNAVQPGANYHFSFADVAVYLYSNGPFLRVTTETHFTDHSGRKDYQTQEYFESNVGSGTWINTSARTRSIDRLSLQFTSPTSAAISVFGSCTPTDCPWGTQHITYTMPVLYSYYNQGFATKEVVVGGDGPQIQVQTFVHFTDNSGRKDYHTIEYLNYAG